MKNPLTFFKNKSINLFTSGSKSLSRDALIVLQKLQSIEGEFRQERVLNILRDVKPDTFMELIANAYIMQNYKPGRRSRDYEKNKGYTFHKDGNTFLICASQNREIVDLIDVGDFITQVREMGVIGIFVHTARTSQFVLNFIKNTRIQIVSGENLVTLICPYKSVDFKTKEVAPQLMYGS